MSLNRNVLDIGLWMGLICDINRFLIFNFRKYFHLWYIQTNEFDAYAKKVTYTSGFFIFSFFLFFSPVVILLKIKFLKIFSFFFGFLDKLRFWIFESSNWLRFELISLDKSFLFSSFSHFKGVIGLLLRVLSSFRINLRRREKHDNTF